MADWPSRTWTNYPGPNRCEDGCGREAVVRLTWTDRLDRVERYCAGCAEQEELKLEAAGAGRARVALSSIIGADDAPQTDEARAVGTSAGLGTPQE